MDDGARVLACLLFVLFLKLVPQGFERLLLLLELLREDGVKLGLILWCWGGADSSSLRTAC